VIIRRNGHVRWPRSRGGPATVQFRAGPSKIHFDLVRDHALQYGLIGGIRHHARVQFVFALARLGRQDVPGKSMMPDNLSRPGFLKPFRRTFMGLQLRHGKSEF